MKKNRNTDWTDALRSALRDAEVSPAEDGWERLQRRLEESEARAEVPPVALPRRSVWRIHGPRIAAAAAVVLLGVVVGELLWRPDKELGEEVAVAASMTEVRGDAADRSAEPQVRVQQPGTSPAGGTLRESVARASGWEQSPSGGTEAAEPLLARVSQVQARDAKAGSDGAGVPLRAVPELRSEEAAAAETRSDAAPKSRSAEESAPEDAGRSSADARRNAAEGTSFPAFDDPFREEPRKRANTSMSLFAGGGMTGSTTMPGSFVRSYSAMSNDAVSLIGNGNNFSPMERRDYDESSFRHHLPLSVGFTVRKEFPHALSLESGLVYTFLRSDVRLRYSSEDVGQKLHFIGIPLRLNWQFVESGRFSAYLGAGGMVEKCISAKFGSEAVDEGAIQWSALAAVGAQYRLSDYVGLYFEPEASYYFTETNLRTSRSEAPLSLTLRLGVRVLF